MGSPYRWTWIVLLGAIVAIGWWWSQRTPTASTSAAPGAPSTRTHVTPSAPNQPSSSISDAGQRPADPSSAPPASTATGGNGPAQQVGATRSMSPEELRSWVTQRFSEMWAGEDDLGADSDGGFDPFADAPDGIDKHYLLSPEEWNKVKAKYETVYKLFGGLRDEERTNPELLRLLASMARDRSAHAYARRYAITLLGSVASSESVETLSLLLRSNESPFIRSLAIRALGADSGHFIGLDPDDSPAILEHEFISRGPGRSILPDPAEDVLLDERIVDALESYVSVETDERLRRAAFQALGHLPNATDRQAVGRWIDQEHLPDFGSLARFFLHVAQTDPSEEIRREATQLVAGCDIPGVGEAGVALMWSDRSPAVRASAAETVLRTHDEVALRQIEEYLRKEPDAEARNWAFSALLQSEADFQSVRPDWVRVVSQGLDDSNEDMRINSARFLTNCGRAEGLAAVRSAFARERSPRVAEEMQRALKDSEGR